MAEYMHIRKEKIYGKRTDGPVNEFTEENVDRISKHFLGISEETRGGSLNSKQRMEIFLRYLSDPGFQIGLGEEVGVHRTTVCKTIKFVMEKVLEKCSVWIKFPTTNLEIAEAKEAYRNKFTFPSAIGAIDCTHVAILKPKEFGDEYVNRKGFALSIFKQHVT